MDSVLWDIPHTWDMNIVKGNMGIIERLQWRDIEPSVNLQMRMQIGKPTKVEPVFIHWWHWLYGCVVPHLSHWNCSYSWEQGP